tara:strand:- start:3683 stop:5137 length:1455 start_codon:yes stop_codon:yes gene_type:complete
MSYQDAKLAVQKQIDRNNAQSSDSPNLIQSLAQQTFAGVISEVGKDADYSAEIKDPFSRLIDQATGGAITKAKERLFKKQLARETKTKLAQYEAEAPLRALELNDTILKNQKVKAAATKKTNTKLASEIMPFLNVPDNLKTSFRDMLINNTTILSGFANIVEQRKVGKDIEVSFIGKDQDYLKGIKVSDTIIGDDGKEYIAYNRTDNVSNFKRYSAKLRSNVVNYLDNKFTDTESREYKAVQNLKETGLLSLEEKQLLIPHMRDAVTTRAGIDPELKRSVNAIIAGHTTMNDNIDKQIFQKLDDALKFTIRNNSSEVNKINSQINALRRSIADAKAVPIAEREQGLEGEISRQERVIENLQKQRQTFQFNIQKAETNVAERTAVKSLLKNRIIARAIADKNLDQLNQPDVVRQYAAEVLKDTSFQKEASSLVKQLQQYGLISRSENEQEIKSTLQKDEEDLPPENKEEEEEIEGGRKLKVNKIS